MWKLEPPISALQLLLGSATLPHYAIKIAGVTLLPVWRWFAGILGVALLGFALVLAWVRPESVSAVAFVTAGAVFLIGGLVPRLPSKVTVAGTSAEWKEAVIRQAYIATVEREAPHVVGGSPTGGPAYGPNLEDILEKAGGAETPEELLQLVAEAQEIARARIITAKTGAIG